MLVEERAASYVRSLIHDEDDIVEEIGKQAITDFVPIIRPETREFLKVLFKQKKPLRVLEIGTAVGYSAICMSRWLPEDGHITTIENYPPRIEQAKENFVKAGAESRITLLEGDAKDVLKELTGCYDFIFMDAAKGQYLHFFDDVLRLLAPEGVLVSDNVLQEGEILESHFTVPKRNRTIHHRLREYLYTIKNHPILDTAVLTVGDGMAVSVKKNESGE